MEVAVALGAAEQGLDAGVERVRALRALAQRGEQPNLAGQQQRRLRVVTVLQGTPRGEQCLAPRCLQRIPGVGVEVHA